MTQKVEIYYDMVSAKIDMDKHIRQGWKIHNCTMGTYMAGYASSEKVIVVYEQKE